MTDCNAVTTPRKFDEIVKNNSDRGRKLLTKSRNAGKSLTGSPVYASDGIYHSSNQGEDRRIDR